jgi:hypothetical protein
MLSSRLCVRAPLRFLRSVSTVTRARLVCALLAALALLAVAAPAGAAGWLVRAGREDQIKALFGEAWGGAIGPFHVTRGRVLASSVVVSLIADGRSATIRLEHPDDAPAAPDPSDAFTIVARDRGLAVTATCAPACSAADAALLRRVAERIVARYAGDLFLPAPEVTSISGASPASLAGEAPLTAHRGARLGRIDAWSASIVVFAVSASIAVITLVQRLRSKRHGIPRLVPDMAVVFAGTIALAWLLAEPGMSNWYLDFLPATGRAGPYGDRLGAGGLVFELPFRAILPWTDRTLYGVTLGVGAAGAALMYAAFRALALPRATCFAAMALFASSPLGARALWSGSVHVIVFALYALLLFAWLRAQDPGRSLEAALALALVPALGLVRAEAILFAAMPLVWGLARGGLRRRLGLAAIYGAVLAASAWLTWLLVVLPSGAPLPGGAARRFAAQALIGDLGLFGRLFRDTELRWFPLPLAVLATAGAALLAVRRPVLLAKILVTLALPQIALGRFMDDEGLVGCRYFLPALPLLTLLAAAPLGPLAAPRRRARGAAYAIAFLAAEAATVIAAWPAYRYRYTFQEEYGFLRAALAATRGPCRVYHVAVDDDPIYRADADCCLSPRRSPLTLALPTVDFEPLGVEDDGGFRIRDEACAYYFESAICSYGPTEPTESRNPAVSARLHDLCTRLAADPRLVAEASVTVPAHATWRFFPAPEVRLRLSRLRPATEGSTR